MGFSVSLNLEPRAFPRCDAFGNSRRGLIDERVRGRTRGTLAPSRKSGREAKSPRSVSSSSSVSELNFRNIFFPRLQKGVSFVVTSEQDIEGENLQNVKHAIVPM